MRLAGCVIAFSLLSAAADKKPPAAQGANDRISLSATLLNDKESIARELGEPLEQGFILVRVEVTPKSGSKVAVTRDDFLLRSYKDGQRSGAFHPSQIAGKSALVISSRGGGGPVGVEQGGPVWGPIGTGGPPRRLPGNSGTIGSSGGTSEAQVTLAEGDRKKKDPLLAVLKAKVLAEKETSEPLSGLLYFSLEGKHKPKDLSLQYNGPAGKLILEFRQ
jgi:hypothetical protein